MIDWKYFPHIFDCIYDNLDGEGLEALRSTCSSLRARVEKDLWEDVTISHRVLYASSSGSVPQPEAVILTLTQLYSARYDCPVPHAHANGHYSTKVVNLAHPPTQLCWYGSEELYEDGRWCPIALHLLAVDEEMGPDVVVRLLDPDTYNCQDLEGAAYKLRCKTLVNSQALRTRQEQRDPNYLYAYPAKQNIFKLAYKSNPGSNVMGLFLAGFFPSRSHDATIVLHPQREEGAGDSGPRATEGAPFDLSSLLQDLAEAGQEFREIFVVATDTWPPEGPFELRHQTPEISETAFAAAWKRCFEGDKESSPPSDRIEVISWPDARFKFGNTVCDLLMSEPSPLRLSQDGAPPWEESQS